MSTAFKRISCIPHIGVACGLALSCACMTAFAEEDAGFVIGVRRENPAAATLSNPTAKTWFKAGLSNAEFHADAVSAAKVLAANKLSSSDADDLKQAVLREKTRSTPEFLWLLNWKNCGDPLLRRGAIAGLALCNPDSKIVGKPLAMSAIYEPDADTRSAAVELIRIRKDPAAARAMLDTWKSAFDDVGLGTTNEATRKAAVAAMHDVADKRVFQALLYYATLELHAGSATPVRVDTVSIKGKGINLPIDLPVLDLISVEGTITVPAMGSLRQATGQDFGHNFDKWKDWINKLP